MDGSKIVKRTTTLVMILFFFFFSSCCMHPSSLTHSLNHLIIQSLICSPRGEKRKKLYRMYDQHDTAEGKGESGENVVVRLSS